MAEIIIALRVSALDIVEALKVKDQLLNVGVGIRGCVLLEDGDDLAGMAVGDLLGLEVLPAGARIVRRPTRHAREGHGRAYRSGHPGDERRQARGGSR